MYFHKKRGVVVLQTNQIKKKLLVIGFLNGLVVLASFAL